MTPEIPLHAGIYLRVSTDHQTHSSQLLACTRECERRGWSHHVYQDVCSGSLTTRDGLEQLLHAARRRTIGAIVVFGLTRLGRNANHVYGLCQELKEMGVQLVSIQEPWIGQSVGALGDLMIYIVGFCAQWERMLTVERVRAGQAAARARGVKMGRRPAPIEPEELLDLARRGQSVMALARHFGVDHATIRRHMAKLKEPAKDFAGGLAGPSAT